MTQHNTMKTYDNTRELEPVTMTGKERDTIVNILRTVEINRFGEAFTAMDIANRFGDLKRGE